MACRECHMAKVKCDKVIPCSRCVRLSKVCVRHESRQGQGRSKKRARTSSSTAPKISEDAALSSEVGSLKPNHYGLRYLVRSWISIAARRRNFGLLARAGMIAERSGIGMDQILCEQMNGQRGMDFLFPLLLTPSPQQQVVGSRLSWREIPPQLLVATGCVGATDDFNNPIVADRWIWIREIRQGVSRYLVTPAFGRQVAEWNLIQETYQANEKSVIELFLSPSEISKHTKALAHQVSLHSTPNLPLQSNSMKCKLKVKQPPPLLHGGATNNNHSIVQPQAVSSKPQFAAAAATAATAQKEVPSSSASTTSSTSSSAVVDVDQVMCLCIVHLDHDFSLVEYIPHNNINKDASALEAHQEATLKSGVDLGLPLLDLDKFDDGGDLDFFLNMLK